MIDQIEITLTEPITILEAVLRGRKLSKRKAGELTELPRNTVSRTALASTTPDGGTIAKLSEGLGVSADHLVDQCKYMHWSIQRGGDEQRGLVLETDPITLLEMIVRLKGEAETAIGRRSKLPRSSVVRIVKGQSSPQADTGLKLAKGLGLPVSVVLSQKRSSNWTLCWSQAETRPAQEDEDAHDAA